MRFPTPTLLLTTALSALPACNSPSFKHDHAIRQERTERLREVVATREYNRPERIHALSDTTRRLGHWRADNLGYTARMPEERERRRRDRLQEQAPERHERVRSIFRGKPETIPRTWADMVY